jgi:UDP:flavonoid glycosyltransferase YjiC (YdhE family)
MAQAFEAGTPQVLIPWHLDQPDNAARATKLGVGTVIKYRFCTGPAVAGAVQSLIHSSKVAHRCKAVAGKFHKGEALEKTCKAIEALVEFY